MNRLKFLFMPVCMAFFFAACNGDSSSASSDGISTSVDQEMSSSADVPASSEDVPLSSSEQSSSSVQESSSSLVDEFEWNNHRGDELQIVERFSGDTSDIQNAGRVWIALEDSAVFFEVLDSLGVHGIEMIESRDYKRKSIDIYMTRFKQDIPKTTLAEIIPGFFNSFNVDDTTKIKVSLSEYEKEYLSTDECGVAVECWKDISEEACNEIMESCGCSVDPGDVNWCGGESSMSYESSVTIESVDCLASHRDVLRVDVGCAEAD